MSPTITVPVSVLHELGVAEAVSTDRNASVGADGRWSIEGEKWTGVDFDLAAALFHPGAARELEALSEEVSAVTGAETALDHARQDRNKLIVAALKRKVPYTKLSKITGLSRAQLHVIRAADRQNQV